MRATVAMAIETTAIVLLMIALIAAPAAASDWSAARKDAAHTSCADAALTPPLAPDWHKNAGASIVASPVISDGVLYYANDTGNTLIAVNMSSGVIRFRHAVGGMVESTPAVTADAIIFGSYDGYVYSLSRQDGALQWRTSLGAGIFSSPLVYQGRVYIGTDDGAFYALREDDGAVAWSLPDNATQGSPAGADGMVFIGMLDGRVYALDPASGATIWAFDTGDSVHASPAVYNGMVFVVSRPGMLYALDGDTGVPVWTVDLGYKTDASPAIDLATGTVYVGTFGGYVHAVNASTGRLRWVSGFYGPVYSTAAVSGGTVYSCAQDGTLFALDAATGAGLWSYDLGGEVWASPAIADGSLAIGTLDGQLFTFKESPGPAASPTAVPASAPVKQATTPFPGFALCVAALAAGAALCLRRR